MNKPGYLTISYPNGHETTVSVKSYAAACTLATVWILSVEPTPCRVGFDCADEKGGTAFFSLDLTPEADALLSASSAARDAKEAAMREKHGDNWSLYM